MSREVQGEEGRLRGPCVVDVDRRGAVTRNTGWRGLDFPQDYGRGVESSQRLLTGATIISGLVGR